MLKLSKIINVYGSFVHCSALLIENGFIPIEVSSTFIQ